MEAPDACYALMAAPCRLREKFLGTYGPSRLPSFASCAISMALFSLLKILVKVSKPALPNNSANVFPFTKLHVISAPTGLCCQDVTRIPF